MQHLSLQFELQMLIMIIRHSVAIIKKQSDLKCRRNKRNIYEEADGNY